MADDNKLIAKLEVQGEEAFIASMKEVLKSSDSIEDSLAKIGKSPAFKDLNKEVKVGIIEGYVDALKHTETQLKANGQSTTKVVAVMKELGKVVVDADKGVKNQKKSLSELDAVMNGVKDGTITLTAAQKALEKELGRLALSNKQNTKEYKDLKAAAGQLKDTILDVKGEIKTAGSDTRGLDKALRATTVLVGGFTAVQGAAALFGKQGEELQKVLLRVNAAMALLQGLQQIQEELSKKDSLITGALTKAKQLYTTAIKGATISTQLFYGVLTGGLLIALGLLITYWNDIAKAIGFASDSTKDLAKVTEELTKIEEGRKVLQDAELRYMKAKGVSQDQIIKKEIAIAETELSRLETLVKISKFQFINPNDPQAFDKRKKAEKEAIEVDKQFAAQLLDSKSKLLELKKSLNDFYKGDIKVSPIKDAAGFADMQIEALLPITPESKKRALEQMRQFLAQFKVDNPEEIRNLLGLEKKDIQPGNLITSPDTDKPTLIDQLFGTQRENETQMQFRIRMMNENIGELQNVQGALSGFTQSLFESEFQALEEKRKRGLISEKQYAKEVAKIRRQQAIAAKAEAAFNITINIAQAITKALTTGPIIGQVLAGITAALGFAQLAVVLARPIPTFKHGGLTDKVFKGSGYVSGKSHAHGGVNANLEGNEFVQPGTAVKKYGVKMMESIRLGRYNPIEHMKGLHPSVMIPDIASMEGGRDLKELIGKFDNLEDAFNEIARHIRTGNDDRRSGNDRLLKNFSYYKTNPHV